MYFASVLRELICADIEPSRFTPRRPLRKRAALARKAVGKSSPLERSVQARTSIESSILFWEWEKERLRQF
jgi:hypothetical protein